MSLSWQNRLHYSLCCLLAFVLPFPFFAGSVAVILLSAAWLAGGFYKDLIQKFRATPILLLWLLFYLLHAFSYTYSVHQDRAAFDLGRKISFVVLPVIIGAGPMLTRERLTGIFQWFCLGICAIAVFCLCQAGIRVAQDGDSGHLLYHDLVHGLDANAVYTSWYVIIALVWLLLSTKPFTTVRLSKYRGWFVALLLGFLVLLSCRLLLVLFFLCVVPMALWRLRRHVSKKAFAGTAVAVLLLLAVLAFTQNPVKARFIAITQQNARQSFLPDYRNDPQEFTNLTLRLFLWRIALENMQRHHLWLRGAGCGDVEPLQDQRMYELGIRNIYPQSAPSPWKGVNVHNMYLHILVMLGIPGLLVLIMLITGPLFLTHTREEKPFFLFFFLISLLFMMQEAALQTQAGIISYTFFHCVYFNRRAAVNMLERRE